MLLFHQDFTVEIYSTCSDDFIIFSGGMPKSSYGDKFTVTIMCGDQHQVLDLSSKVINFFTISDVFDESGRLYH